MNPKVSVIVPTYNGEKKIPILLNALQMQTFQDFELIMLIDGSTDQTTEIIKSTETKFQKTVVIQANQGRAIAKKNEARQAKGDLLIFYDDDMEPNSRSVERHAFFHSESEGLLTGNQIETQEKWKTDIQNYKAHLSKKWIAKYNEGINEMYKSSLFFTAANCSIQKDLFFALNGFDERLTDAEDYDIAARAINSGIKVFFDKSNVAIHHDLITCVGYIKRLREYNKAQQKVASFHSDLELFANLTISNWKKLLYTIFSFAIFPKTIDNFNIFLLLPRRLRYQLYSVVIHALSKINSHVRL